MSDPPVYIMLGHGTEIPVDFHKRNTLPPPPWSPTAEFTLVTSTECGRTTTSEQLSHLIEVLKANEALARDPYTNREELSRILGFEIRVYKRGDRYPKLFYKPKSFHANDTLYDLSGVVNLKSLTDDDITFIRNPKSTSGKSEMDIIYESWNKSRFPKKGDITSLDDENLRLTPIETVLGSLGPGIYYFPVCRHFDPAHFPRANPNLIKHLSTQQQQTMRGGRGRGKRMKKRLTRRRKYGTRRTAMRLV